MFGKYKECTNDAQFHKNHKIARNLNWFQVTTRSRICLSLVQKHVDSLNELLTRSSVKGRAHVHNLDENRGVSMANAWVVIA